MEGEQQKSQSDESLDKESNSNSNSNPSAPGDFFFVNQVSDVGGTRRAVQSFVQRQTHRKRKEQLAIRVVKAKRDVNPTHIESDKAAKPPPKRRIRSVKCEVCGEVVANAHECPSSSSSGDSSSSLSIRRDRTIQINPHGPEDDLSDITIVGDDDDETEDFIRDAFDWLQGNPVRLKKALAFYAGPRTILGAGRVDPFRTLPVQEEGADFFVDAFLSMDQRIFGTPVGARFQPTRDTTFRLAMNDPLSTMSIMAYGASAVPDAGPVTLVLKGKAIKMVNERLKNHAPGSQNDDFLIHAISQLWLMEYRYGSLKSAQWHAQAVATMIASRGGYKELDWRLKIHVGWCIITTPDIMNLTTYPQHEYIYHSFTDFLELVEVIHERAMEPDSPYYLEQARFAQPHRLHELLAGRDESETKQFHPQPRLRSLCYMTSLLFIHRIFLGHRSPSNITAGLESARRKVWKAQQSQRFVTTESLPAILALEDNRADAIDDNLWVLQMIMVIKMFSSPNVKRLIEIFRLYVNGESYDPLRRKELWDPYELERDLHRTMNLAYHGRLS